MAEMTEEQRRALEEKLRLMSPEELKEFQKKQCIFCRMVAGEIPAKKVYEDDKIFAIMDINPATAGHVLLLPKEHYVMMQQMPDDDVGHVFLIARAFSQAFLQTLKVEGSSIFVASGGAAGQRAQHVIVHVIPRSEADDADLKPKPIPASLQDLERTALALQPFVAKALGHKVAHEEQPKAADKLHKLASSVSLPSPVSKSDKAEEARTLPEPWRKKKKESAKEERSSLDDIADFLTKS